VHRLALWIETTLTPALGPFGVLVVTFLDSSFLSFPELTDLLVVAGAAGSPAQAPLFAAMATLGSLAGCLTLWEVGRRGGDERLLQRFGPERVARVRSAFGRFDVLALAVPALLPPPMPFKIFVLTAAVLGMPRRRFALTLLVARGLVGAGRRLRRGGPAAAAAVRRVVRRPRADDRAGCGRRAGPGAGLAPAAETQGIAAYDPREAAERLSPEGGAPVHRARAASRPRAGPPRGRAGRRRAPSRRDAPSGRARPGRRCGA
jgi:membrane protein YqaA with SNARE-associated domain